MDARQLLADLTHFPWKSTALTLGERFREDRLGLTASSLTFTTTMALVPFFTVALAVFTAFPVFGKLQGALQAWLVQSLVPDAIARQVLGYLTQFAGKASRLGALGLAVLFVTALALVLTIDRTLNSIWRVKRRRPLGQRVLVYWAVMTLGPLLLGASLSISSYLISASRGLVASMPGGVQLLLDVIQFFLLAAGLAALYRYVPNTPVRRSHAWAGGLFAAIGIELARSLLALYLGKVPTYSAVYGAFATVPILLVWIYIAWVIVLWGAVIAAYLPSLVAGTRRRATAHGWQFQLALEVLRELDRARSSAQRGLSALQLARALEAETLQLEPVLETLVALDWVGRVNEIEDEEETRYILLAEAQSTVLEPLIRNLLLPYSDATDKLWKSGQLSSVYLKDVI
ncbi:YihY family inner membrane protein [Caenimonas soli]|uniref:YihY family inner membrane protein n=1 Tax=Caenimonas soli TaxID=2735555 RepID=UPI001553A700|nr:YihY family inner membrane protein [Caenimonas soli]NPC55571.1 YihY family inner membrane protein [Caenimonas soli]